MIATQTMAGSFCFYWQPQESRQKISFTSHIISPNGCLLASPGDSGTLVSNDCKDGLWYIAHSDSNGGVYFIIDSGCFIEA